MTDIPKQRGVQVTSDIEVRNRLQADITVVLAYAEVRINLAKCQAPVIITLSPGRR